MTCPWCQGDVIWADDFLCVGCKLRLFECSCKPKEEKTMQVAVSETGGISLSVSVAPFARVVSCPKCANPPVSRLMSIMRKLRGEPPAMNVGRRYCKGGLPPTGEMTAVQEVMYGVKEYDNPCAGVLREHLHLTCGACSFHWLMWTAGK